MFRRANAPLVITAPVPLPTGNVAVVAAPTGGAPQDMPAQRATGHRLPVADGPSTGWSIRNTQGEIVFSDMPTKAAASRMLGVLVVNGAELPLLVHGPDGRPTGERLG